MTLTVLTDDEIRLLLENLTPDDLTNFRDDLRAALHLYSAGTQTSTHQPERTSVHSEATGATTLFMPSASPAGQGVKVVTLSSAKTQDGDDDKDSATTPPVIKPTGAITLFSPQGTPLGILHASTLTAFRTALASLCLVSKRDTIRKITVFGCGEQAYWHVRLTLMLRGSTIRHVNLINRRFSQSCKTILKRFYSIPSSTKTREGWNECTFGVLTPGYGEYERLLREQVQGADIIFCCTPSTLPLFDAGILTEHEARRKGRLIVAIGSYTPEMREVPVELIRQATKVQESKLHFHKHAREGGVIVVDTLDGALKEAGELIEAGVEPKQLVELGELVMLHRIALSEDEEMVQSPEDSASSVISSIDFEKMEIASQSSGSTGATGSNSNSSGSHFSIPSAMSSVFGNKERRSSGGGGSGSRTSSPTRKSLKASIFHRRVNSSSHEDYEKSSLASPTGEESPTTPQVADHELLQQHRLSSETKKKSKKENSDANRLAGWLQKGNVIYKSVGLGLMDLTVGLHVIKYAAERGIGSQIEGF
ncbi:ornithine cyclodeaminase [Apodospora peruviana]|uniref:Ornithine cyclodeaminase n=1 Tax=Apodospora peruviana TaxID=516989 RepID=A0AAE0I0R9_9PEZI|nr:ornithine cyclodeaminase [Apodospora peruviana]